MALIRCPECQREVSDQAIACPACGYPIRGLGPGSIGPLPFRAPFFEYKSKRKVFGLPLVHVVYGPAWAGGYRPAKGFIAIGNIAVGVIAIGGLAAGIFTLAGIGLGLICIAGLAFGIGLGVGGIATGYLAVGGLAVGIYALGGLGVGVHTLFNDPQFRDALRRLLTF